MTLRLDEELNDALKDVANRDGRSMQQTVVRAVAEYVEREGRTQHVRHLAHQGVHDYPETLRRLGE